MLQILLIIYLHPKSNKQERVEWIIPVAANMTSQQWAIVTRSLQIRRDDLCSTILASMYALHCLLLLHCCGQLTMSWYWCRNWGILRIYLIQISGDTADYWHNPPPLSPTILITKTNQHNLQSIQLWTESTPVPGGPSLYGPKQT